MPDDDLIAAFLSRHAAACPDCGYSLKDIKSSRCPECGTALRLTIGAPRQVKWPWLASFGCSCVGAGTGLVGWILGGYPSDIFDDFWFEGFFLGYFILLAPVIAMGLLVLQKPFRRLSTVHQSIVAAVIAGITLICYGLFIAEFIFS